MNSKAIETYKLSLKLTTEQREALVGLLLGDACLETQNKGRTYRLKIEQSVQHQAYVQHLYQLFEPWVLTAPRQRAVSCASGLAVESCFFQTVSHSAFRFYAQQFYAEGKKRVPKLIHRWLTPRGLAYWFMDDGSMKSNQSKGVIFNTQGFVPADVERLITLLQTEFGLQCSVRRQKEGNQVYVSGKSFADFTELIDPFIIDDMRYKMPQARRTHLPKE